jgi:2-C-methyl-D-erythritol 4-phosphate cytidylyltransferase
MIYGAVLGGGKGQRMGNTEKPKQFLLLGDKPIIIHTLEKFLMCNRMDYIFVGVPSDWVPHTQDIVKKYIPNAGDRIIIVAGGTDRNKTIVNIINDMEKRFGLNDDDVIITHDAVRPFVTHRILNENIDAVLEYGSSDTIIPATDTIVESDDGDLIKTIPERKKMYQGQTPQGFNVKLLIDHYNSLTEAEKDILTDASKIFVLKGEKVKVVQGTVFNIKITTPYDLLIANALLREELND